MDFKRQGLRTMRQWLSPGMHIKRWLLLLIVGAVLMGLGLILLVQLMQGWGLMPEQFPTWLTLSFLPLPLRIMVISCVGGLLVVLALLRLGHTLVRPFRRPGDSITASLYDYGRRSRGPHVVAIGGGTGLPALLRGLKEHTSNITAIVTVADDGGSSGRLRQELGMLPPGDLRNNMAALSRDEGLMTRVLQYRFGAGSGAFGNHGSRTTALRDGNGREHTAGGERTVGGDLQGHAFGNLLLAALTGITGSFDEALLAAERVLAMQGRVLPSTLEMVTLVADVKSKSGGKIVRVSGESAITKAGGRIQHIYLEPGTARAYPPALQSILQAQMVVIGPGSLFTSIMPNLLVRGVVDALHHTRAAVVYVCNLATQPGETDAFTVADHVDAIVNVMGSGCLDYVVANNRLALPADAPGATILVKPAWPPRLDDGISLVETDLVDEARPWRHDSVKLARTVRRLLDQGLPTRP